MNGITKQVDLVIVDMLRSGASAKDVSEATGYSRDRVTQRFNHQFLIHRKKSGCVMCNETRCSRLKDIKDMNNPEHAFNHLRLFVAGRISESTNTRTNN